MPLGRKQKQVLERLEGLRLPSSNLGLTRWMTPEFVRTLRLGGQRRCLHGSTRSELKTSVLIAGGIAAYANMIAREKNGTTCSFDLNTVSPSPGERRACTHYRRPVPDHHPKTSSDSQHAASRQHPVSSIETTTAAAVTLQFGNSVCIAELHSAVSCSSCLSVCLSVRIHLLSRLLPSSIMPCPDEQPASVVETPPPTTNQVPPTTISAHPSVHQVLV